LRQASSPDASENGRSAVTAAAPLSRSRRLDAVESKRDRLPIFLAISRPFEICRLRDPQMLIILTGSMVRVFIGMQNSNAILKYFAATL
jgi:hypothetical protein